MVRFSISFWLQRFRKTLASTHPSQTEPALNVTRLASRFDQTTRPRRRKSVQTFSAIQHVLRHSRMAFNTSMNYLSLFASGTVSLDVPMHSVHTFASAICAGGFWVSGNLGNLLLSVGFQGFRSMYSGEVSEKMDRGFQVPMSTHFGGVFKVKKPECSIVDVALVCMPSFLDDFPLFEGS